MVRKFFGTDGIRGRANGTITPELALKVGQAAGEFHRVKDERAGAVAPRMRERQADAPVGEELEALLRERRPHEVVASCGPTSYADLRDHFVVAFMG